MNTIDKLDLRTPNFVNENIEKLAALFPHCVTEAAEGRKIDFDLLQQELSHDIVDGSRERYRLEWPGKREAIVTANLPTTKTLRPVREDSVDFDNTENLYIEGDNLEVLKLLQESYRRKIKMIYIDPPYNTGNDFVYRDNFATDRETELFESGQIDEYGKRMVANPETSGRYHSDWLTMMYPRLKLARNLLTDDGVIFISIDDNEVHNLRKVCDEVFGEGNFIGQVVVKSNPRGSQSESELAGLHEYILVYTKSILNTAISGHDLTEEMISEYKHEENGRKYRLLGLRQRGGFWRRTERPNLYFPIYVNPNDGNISLIKDNIFTEEILPVQPSTGEDGTWRWGKEKIKVSRNELVARSVNRNGASIWDVFQKDYIDRGEIRKTKAKSLWDEKEINYQNGTIEVKELLSSGAFDYAKPVYLVKRAIQMLQSNNNDIILDFFSGSATTAHAVMQLNAEDGGNRKFIMVQLPEKTDEKSEAYKAGYKNICEIGKERIRRAGAKMAPQPPKGGVESASLSLFGTDTANSELKTQNSKLDVGFRVYRLADSNMQDVYYRPQDYKQETLNMFADNIKPDRTADDLLAQVMLDWGLPLSYKIEQLDINGKQVFRVAQDSLLACFDTGIDEAFAKAVAKEKPVRVVFRDSGFASDTAKINVQQLLKQLSPETEMKVI